MDTRPIVEKHARALICEWGFDVNELSLMWSGESLYAADPNSHVIRFYYSDDEHAVKMEQCRPDAVYKELSQ